MQTDMIAPLVTAAVSGGSAAVAAILVAVIQSKAQHSKVLAEMDKRDALQAQRIEQLEKKMDQHNRIIERTYALEKRADVHDEKLKVADHRIGDLEKKG